MQETINITTAFNYLYNLLSTEVLDIDTCLLIKAAYNCINFNEASELSEKESLLILFSLLASSKYNLTNFDYKLILDNINFLKKLYPDVLGTELSIKQIFETKKKSQVPENVTSSKSVKEFCEFMKTVSTKSLVEPKFSELLKEIDLFKLPDAEFRMLIDSIRNYKYHLKHIFQVDINNNLQPELYEVVKEKYLNYFKNIQSGKKVIEFKDN